MHIKQHETRGNEVLTTEVIALGALTLSPSLLILTLAALLFHPSFPHMLLQQYVTDKRFHQINEKHVSSMLVGLKTTVSSSHDEGD